MRRANGGINAPPLGEVSVQHRLPIYLSKARESIAPVDRLENRRQYEPSPPAPRSRRRRRWWILPSVGVLLVSGISYGTVLFNGQFPEEEIVSCTVEDAGPQTHRRSAIRAKLLTDCGRLRASTQVECTTDGEQDVTLILGTTYDFVVRGPRIPLLSAPSIVSATVSSEQLYEASGGVTEVDPSAHENLQKLQRAQLPETWRAFDYEQPPYDPSCDSYRKVMTTKGLQIVSPARADEMLTAPSGVVPRDPKLPCEGYECSMTS